MSQTGQLQTGTSQAPITPPNNNRYPLLKTFQFIVFRILGWLVGIRKFLLSWYVLNVLWNVYMIDNVNLALLGRQLQCADRSKDCVAFYTALAIPGPELFSTNSPVWVHLFDGALIASLVYLPFVYQKLKEKLQPTVRDHISEAEHDEVQSADKVSSATLYTPPFEHNILFESPDQRGKIIGRKTYIGPIVSHLRSRQDNVIVLYGIAGIGKTSLAAEALSNLNVKRQFPDGVAVARCQDQYNWIAVINLVLKRFKLEELPVGKTDVQELRDIVSQLFVQRKALIVLDNVEPRIPIQALQTVLCAAPGIKLLITTRSQPNVHTRIYMREIKELSFADAVQLYKTLLRERNYTKSLTGKDNEEAIGSIVTKFKQHTLAVKLMAAYTVVEKTDLIDLAREIKDDPDLIFRLETIESDIEALFNKSLQDLDEVYNRFFAALAAFPSIEFSKLGARALALAFVDSTELKVNEKPEHVARRMVDKLVGHLPFAMGM